MLKNGICREDSGVVARIGNVDVAFFFLSSKGFHFGKGGAWCLANTMVACSYFLCQILSLIFFFSFLFFSLSFLESFL